AGVASLVVGAAIAFLAADLAADDPDATAPTTQPVTDDAGTAPAVPAATTSTTVSSLSDPTVATQQGGVLLVWTSGGLPPGTSSGAAALPEVDRLAVVRGGQADLVRSARSDGTAVDEAPDGWAIPLDTIAVDPATFASFTD